jgi:hypothetical protein
MSWRLAKHRYEIVGTKCKNSACGAVHFPPRAVCTSCGSDSVEKFWFSGNGKILSYTVIHTAPDGFEKHSPYAIALVQLDEGPVVSAHIVDPDGIGMGKRVRAVFRKLYEDGSSGVISYGFKFELT